MSIAIRVVCAAFLLQAGAPRAVAQLSLVQLLTEEGTAGTPIQLTVLGDVGKGKPRMWLTLTKDASPKPKKTKLAVGTVTSLGGGVSMLTAAFKKTKTGAGLYDIHIKPKGKGQPESVFEGLFSIRAPVTPTPFTIENGFVGSFGMGLTQTKPFAAWGSGGEIPGTLTVTSASATRMEGTFEMELVPAGTPPATIHDLTVTKGVFDLVVEAL